MYYKIAQLILTPQKPGSTCEIFIAQPNADKEALVGKLFILAEIESKNANNLKIINFLIANLNHNYYQNEKIILRERVSGLKIEHIFESALAKTNKNLAEFIQTEKIKLNVNLFNITVGVIHENNLHFAILGKNKALLIYKSIAENNENEYKITDISKQAGNNKQISLNKLFTNVISGSIPRGGYFVFTNEALLEYLSNKQLTNIVTALPPASAVEQIKNTLNKINSYVSFSGIIIKNTLGLEKIKSSNGIIRPSSQASLENLSATEETTEKLLTPTGVINFKKWITFFSKIFTKINFRLIEPVNKSKTFLLKDKILLKRKVSRLSFKKIGRIIKNIFLFSANLAIYIFKTMTNKDEIIKAYSTGKHKLNKKIDDLKNLFSFIFNWPVNWFKKLNKRNKILIIIAAACLLLLAQNLIILDLKNKKTEKEQAYTELTKLIEKKQNQVEASLLYSNEETAKKILKETKELLAQLPQKNAEQIKQFNQYNNKYEQQLEKIRHVIKIKSPTELANFINLNSNARPINLIIIPDAQEKIYAADSEQKTIYIIDLSDNLATAITDLKQNIKELNYPAIDKNNNIYYLNSGGIIQLDTETEEITNLTVNLSGNPQNIVSMAGFNNRLYLLDKQSNQIYRYNKTLNGFLNPQAWLKEKVDFSNAASMSIDGYVYVLKNNGQLFKYLKGQKRKFELDTVEPELKQPTKLIVSPELKYIYIFEPNRQRLVVFNKTGQFLLQYQFDQFTDLKDFTVDETNKKIYFLNGTSVYKINGAHFEK